MHTRHLSIKLIYMNASSKAISMSFNVGSCLTQAFRSMKGDGSCGPHRLRARFASRLRFTVALLLKDLESSVNWSSLSLPETFRIESDSNLLNIYNYVFAQCHLVIRFYARLFI